MKNFLAFLLLLLWLSFGAWLYVCKVKKLCNDGPFLSKLKSNSDTDKHSDSYTGLDTTLQTSTEDSLSQVDKSQLTENGIDSDSQNADHSNAIATAPSLQQLNQPEIEFEYGKHSIYGFGALTRYAAKLKSHLEENSEHIARIKGHTNSFEAGDFKSDLGLKRAEFIQKYLISEGIEEDQLEAISMGAKKPLISNANPIGQSKNKRVEIDIINKQ